MKEVATQQIVGPSSSVLSVLEEAEFSPALDLEKPNGTKVRTRLVREGSGMVGLASRFENQEWSGMFNHVTKTAGGVVVIGELLQHNGQEVDLQLLLDTVMLSHNGRRAYDEAVWYKDSVDQAVEKRQKGDTTLGLENLREHNVSPELCDLVAVHGLGLTYPFEKAQTWNQKLPLYLDYRISQNVLSLDERFSDLQRGVAAGRFTQEFLDQARSWAERAEQEVFTALRLQSYQELVSNYSHFDLRMKTAIRSGKFSPQEGDFLQTHTLADVKENGLKHLGLTEEDFLEKLQLSPADLTEQLIKPRRWERYLRRLYVQDAEQPIFERIAQLREEGEEGREQLDKEFPTHTWWGGYTRELFEKQHGVPSSPKPHLRRGVKRAISFYQDLEEKKLSRG